MPNQCERIRSISEYAASSTELSRVYQRLAAHYTALAEKESVEMYRRLDPNRPQLIQILKICLEQGLLTELRQLVFVTTAYFDRQGYWAELRDIHNMELTAARLLGDRAYEGWCLQKLGSIYKKHRSDGMNDLIKALKLYEQSLAIAQDMGDKKREGVIMSSIAAIYDDCHDYNEALRLYKQSLEIMREFNDLESESSVLNSIATIEYSLCDYESALYYLKQSMLLVKDDKVGEGAILNNLAAIYCAQGNYDKAIEHHEQALAIWQKLGDRGGEAESCWNIGITCVNTGDLAKVVEYMSRAVQIAKVIDHPSFKQWQERLAWIRLILVTELGKW
ncbi:MAG: tetratricopeptide repeat protein [Candidatus Electrothrix sp. AW2]|nr:tetratricopeptide repeat protein [Candidatus Electrothrix gigas]